MKKRMMILGILLIIVLAAGCARVNLGLDKNENIKFNEAGGYASPERGLDILEQQSVAQTSILLQKKLRVAINSGNQGQIDKILQMIEVLPMVQ